MNFFLAAAYFSEINLIIGEFDPTVHYDNRDDVTFLVSSFSQKKSDIFSHRSSTHSTIENSSAFSIALAPARPGVGIWARYRYIRY